MNLVVGEYLEVASKFDGVCLIKEAFQALTSKFPSILKTVQQYHKTYGEAVFDVNGVNDDPKIIYTPLHNMNKVKEICDELQALGEAKDYKSILLPMPSNYDDIKDILESTLDGRFTIITDNPNYIQEIVPVKGEEVMSKRILECSSKGDKRYSAVYAKVEYMGVVDSIEHHYQNSKRFIVGDEYVQLEKPKGKKVDGVVVFGELYDADILTPFYKWLWNKYMTDELIAYARGFDDYNDMFKGKSINCQADVIREIVHNREELENEVSVIHTLEQEWLGSNTAKVVESTDEFITDVQLPRPITLIVTGHRPKDLFGYNPCSQYHTLQNKMYSCILHFVNQYGVTRFISGGAQGADQLFFWACNQARTLNPELQNVVFKPFEGQEKRWLANGSFSQEEYNAMLKSATAVHLCDTNVNAGSPYQLVSKCLQDRNTDMVNEADFVLGIYQGDVNLIANDVNQPGGTLNCLRKAYKAGKKILILNPKTLHTTRIGF